MRIEVGWLVPLVIITPPFSSKVSKTPRIHSPFSAAGSASSYSSITKQMQRYTMVFITIMFYMFQAVPPPIIRSSKLYAQHRVFVKLSLLLTDIVSELELTHDSGNNGKKGTKFVPIDNGKIGFRQDHPELRDTHKATVTHPRSQQSHRTRLVNILPIDTHRPSI
jgi:hypothetical protein